MTTVRLSDKAYVDKAKLHSLILGYSLTSLLSNKSVLPNEISQIINSYIPKQLWLRCDEDLKIINDSVVSSGDNWKQGSSKINAYSMDKADIAFKDKYKFIWKIKLTDLPSMSGTGHGSVDIRIGIASTMGHNHTFTNSHDGHNYAYIAYNNSLSHIGYNADWKVLSSKDTVYWTNDVVTVEVNLRDQEVSYFKNDIFIAKQEKIVDATYRLAVNIMSKSGKMEIISFQVKPFDDE